MSYRKCGVCKQVCGDVQEVFTWSGDITYLCEECADKVREFIGDLCLESGSEEDDEVDEDD